MEIHDFPLFSSISQDPGPAALARENDSNSYAFSMVAALIFLPGHSKTGFSSQNWIRTEIMVEFMKFGGICLRNEIAMILSGPWPARAGNLDIPIGILRFLSLPGPLESLQNRENHEIFIEITLFHSKTGFSAPGPQKMAPERYVYVGFWAGAANVDFWSPRCVFDAQNHKRVFFIGFHRIL